MIEKKLSIINQKDLFHLTKRKSNVMKRNLAIKNLEKQYTFSIPVSILNSQNNRHKTQNSARVQFLSPRDKEVNSNKDNDIFKEIVNTQTTNEPTDNCIEAMNGNVNKDKENNYAGPYNNYNITDNSDNNVISRNKEYKKSVTAFNNGCPKSGSFSIANNNSINNSVNPLKMFNKMNTRVSMNSQHRNINIKAYQSRQSTSSKQASTFNRLIESVPTNPLEVQEEDKIFNLLNQDLDNNQTTNAKPLVLSSQDKPISIFNPNRKVLDKLYHFSSDYIINLEKAKKKKKTLPLDRYQNNLLEAIGDNISRDYKQRLERKFFKLRVECMKSKVRQDIISLEEIEEKEKAIINHTNMCDRYCERMLKTAGSGFRKTKFILPEIKFESVLIGKE